MLREKIKEGRLGFHYQSRNRGGKVRHHRVVGGEAGKSGLLVIVKPLIN